jgi:hypothetical protein
MAALSGMHEDMQKRTRKQKQERQKTERMCPVLGQQKEEGDSQERGEHKSCAGAPKATALIGGVGLVALMSFVKHVFLLFLPERGDYWISARRPPAACAHSK